MKRVTFVLTGIILITTLVLLSRKHIDQNTVEYVKIDAHKYKINAHTPRTQGMFRENHFKLKSKSRVIKPNAEIKTEL